VEAERGRCGERSGARLLAPRAALLARQGRYEEARDWLDLLLEREPHPDLYCLLGKIHAQRGDYDAAKSAFEAALAARPVHAEAAAALIRLRALTEPVPARVLHGWRGATAVLAVLLALAGVRLMSAGPPEIDVAAEPPEIDVAAEPPEIDVAAGVPAADPGTWVAADPRVFEDYAQLAAGIRSLSHGTALRSAPAWADGELRIAVSGSVPTPHLERRLLALGEDVSDPRIALDTTELRVDHRYVVQQGDSLVSIAEHLYGDGSAWRRIWKANADQISNPHIVFSGTTLTVP